MSENGELKLVEVRADGQGFVAQIEGPHPERFLVPHARKEIIALVAESVKQPMTAVEVLSHPQGIDEKGNVIIGAVKPAPTRYRGIFRVTNAPIGLGV